MEIKRAYKFRFYPTPEQELNLDKTFGCARFAYNYMLRLRTDAWMQRQERIGYHETSAALTALKKQPEYTWLNEVSSVPVQQSLRHLQSAFANFFAKRASYPQFKRKNGPQSAEYTTSAFKWDGSTLRFDRVSPASGRLTFMPDTDCAELVDLLHDGVGESLALRVATAAAGDQGRAASVRGVLLVETAGGPARAYTIDVPVDNRAGSDAGALPNGG